jgi:hypothetical protein
VLNVGTRYDDGAGFSLDAKDKAWAESQKRELISNAWEIEKRGSATVRHTGTFLFLGLVFVGGAVVYNARR